jgi:hypothetical protein
MVVSWAVKPCVILQVVTNAQEERIATIFRVEENAEATHSSETLVTAYKTTW